MATRVVLVYTHDSIGLGEDGPTHQPIEHLTSLRAMPRKTLCRPCDGVETAVSWAAALEHSGPTALIPTRQALPLQPRIPQQHSDMRRGGYVLIDGFGASGKGADGSLTSGSQSIMCGGRSRIR